MKALLTKKLLMVSAFVTHNTYAVHTNPLTTLAARALKQRASFYSSARKTVSCPFLERVAPFIKEQEELLKVRLETSRLEYELFRANLQRINFQSGYPFVAIAAQNAKNQQHAALEDFQKAVKEKADEICKELAKEMQESQHLKCCPDAQPKSGRSDNQ